MPYNSKKYNRINWKNRPSTATALGATNLNKMDEFLNDVDNQLITFDTSKLDVATANSMLKKLEIDTATGKIKATELGGTTHEWDLNVEKIPASFSLQADGKLIMTTDDGQQFETDISKAIRDYEFEDTDTIDFTKTYNPVSSESDFTKKGTYTVKAIVKEGSIEGKHLNPDYRAQIQQLKNDAETAASSSLQYSKDSKRYAVGDESYPGSDEDNAKHYYEQAKASKEAAAASQQAAHESEDAAAASQADAASSKDAAAQSAIEAAASQTAAQLSQDEAAKSAESAKSEAAAALVSQQAAAESQSAAETAAQAAEASQTAAAASEKSAEDSATSAKQSADKALEIAGADLETMLKEFNDLRGDVALEYVDVTLQATEWTGEAPPYTQSVSNDKINEQDVWLVKALDKDADVATVKAYNKAFSIITQGTAETHLGNVSFKVLKKPTTDITVRLLMRGADADEAVPDPGNAELDASDLKVSDTHELISGGEQNLQDMMDEIASRVALVDDAIPENIYKFGVENGKLYITEVEHG